MSKFTKEMQAEMDSGKSVDDALDHRLSRRTSQEAAAQEAAAAAARVSGPLPEYFSCLNADGSGSLILRCLKCGKGYKLPAGSVHPGNRIALMNHVRTHSELEEL